MRLLRLLGLALAFVLVTSVAAVYAYVVLLMLESMGVLPTSLAAGAAPALAG